MSPTELQRVALGFASRGDSQAAVIALEALVAGSPASATAWANLAMVYDHLGRIDEADAAAQHALDADPLSDVTRGMVETLRQNTRMREAQQ